MCRDGARRQDTRALAEEDDAALSTRFFAAKPCDDAVRALARGDDEAVAAVAASGSLRTASHASPGAALDALDAVITSEATLAARRAALDDTRRDGLTDAPAQATTSAWPRRSLGRTPPRALAPVLRPLGFPESPLGTRSFVAAAGPRAAAAVGRVWHASDGLAPLVAPAASGDTLVVAFSSLGWHGLLRAEWRGVLRAIGRRNVAHALDTAKSWYCSNPTTGHFDGGAWWDATLAELCAPYKRSFCWAIRWAGRRR